MLWKTEGYLIRYLGHPTLRHLLLEWAFFFCRKNRFFIVMSDEFMASVNNKESRFFGFF